MAVIILVSLVFTVLFSVQRLTRGMVAYICLNSCPAGSHTKSCTPPAQTCSDPMRVTEREKEWKRRWRSAGSGWEWGSGGRKYKWRREAMIASQHVASNYNVVFLFSLSPSFFLTLFQPFTRSCRTCLCAQG